jgi:hypothetical protein
MSKPFSCDSYAPVKVDERMFLLAFFDSRNPAGPLVWSQPFLEKDFRVHLAGMGFNEYQIEQHVTHASPRYTHPQFVPSN